MTTVSFSLRTRDSDRSKATGKEEKLQFRSKAPPPFSYKSIALRKDSLEIGLQGFWIQSRIASPSDKLVLSEALILLAGRKVELWRKRSTIF